MALRFGIFPWPQAVNDVLVGIQMDAAAGAAIGADAIGVFQVPDPLLIKEILAAQGADRANIDDVARQVVVARLARKNVPTAAASKPSCAISKEKCLVSTTCCGRPGKIN